MKRIVSIVLVITMLLNLNLMAFADGQNEVDVDEVVCYLGDVPITCADVDASGRIINQEKVDQYLSSTKQVISMSLKNIMLRSVNPEDPNIIKVSKGTNAIIQKNTAAPRFTQTAVEMYLNPVKGREFGRTLRSASWDQGGAALLMALFSTAAKGPLYAIHEFVNSVYSSEIANRVDNLADYDKYVKAVVIKTSVHPTLTYYVISEWDGEWVDLYTNPSEYVVSKSYFR